MSGEKSQKFERALRAFQIEQWVVSQISRDWRSGSSDDLRTFAHHAGNLGRLFDALLESAGALVAAEAEIDTTDTVADFVAELRKQADKMDAEADEPESVWSPRLEEFV